jgi:hypothetical protein
MQRSRFDNRAKKDQLLDQDLGLTLITRPADQLGSDSIDESQQDLDLTDSPVQINLIAEPDVSADARIQSCWYLQAAEESGLLGTGSILHQSGKLLHDLKNDIHSDGNVVRSNDSKRKIQSQTRRSTGFSDCTVDEEHTDWCKEVAWAEGMGEVSEEAVEVSCVA